MLKENDIVKIPRENISFSYRSCEPQGIIIAVELQLPKQDHQAILESIKIRHAEKAAAQPLKEKSLGCIFKNPKEHPAAWLIEQCGLKGHAVGGAVVSEKHANFIINRNKATAKDVLELIRIIQEKVYERFKITLELEIKVM